MKRLLLFALLAVASLTVRAADEFKPTPYHEVQPGVPQGKLTKMPEWHSQIFTNTVRDWWVYVPAQYKPDGTAAVMVFQDGRNYINPKGNWRAPVVFDNLIARGDMPPTIAVFINPGHDKSKEVPQSPWRSSNRSFEYDSLGDRYARFLLEEIIPGAKQVAGGMSDDRKIKTYDDFVNNSFYNAFVRYGRHLVGIRCVNTSAFTDWLLKNNKKI